MQLDPIDQLLCDCLGNLPDEELSSRLADLSPSDWHTFINRSKDHAVFPLCYKRLKDPALSGSVPARILDELKKQYFRNAYANTIILHSLGKVLQTFNDKGIHAIPLKGAQLAENVYDNIALRVMGDVDLLVHKEDLDQIQQQLTALGYTSRPYWLEAEDDLSHSLPPFIKHNCADLDIHWSFENPDSPFKIDSDGLWQRAVQVKIAGVDVLSLSPEDFLLHLCLHTSYHHRFETGLRSLCDINATITAFQLHLDWTLLLARAREWGAERCVFLSLHLTQKLLGTPLPHGFLEQLEAPDFDSQKETWAIEQIFPGRDDLVPVGVNVSRFWGTQNFPQKVARLLSTVFPSPFMLSTKFPVSPTSKWLIFYYPRLWFGLLSRHGRALWNLMTGNKSSRKANQRQMDAWDLADWLSKPNL